jgi:hypothetical protein
MQKCSKQEKNESMENVMAISHGGESNTDEIMGEESVSCNAMQ